MRTTRAPKTSSAATARCVSPNTGFAMVTKTATTAATKTKSTAKESAASNSSPAKPASAAFHSLGNAMESSIVVRTIIATNGAAVRFENICFEETLTLFWPF